MAAKKDVAEVKEVKEAVAKDSKEVKALKEENERLNASVGRLINEKKCAEDRFLNLKKRTDLSYALAALCAIGIFGVSTVFASICFIMFGSGETGDAVWGHYIVETTLFSAIVYTSISIICAAFTALIIYFANKDKLN